MAKVRRNMLIAGLSGSLGPDHYARITKDGRTIISVKPDFSNRQFSEEQLSHQRKMQQAAAYAKTASKENPLYAHKAAGTSRNAYNIALRDWFKPPVIDLIECQDVQIRVHARDDVMVTRVSVSILDDAGTCLEQGDAELTNGVWWDYHASNHGTIRVEAWDLAANKAQQEFHPPSPGFSHWERPRRLRS